MSPRDLTKRRATEVAEFLASYTPSAELDVDLLSRFCKAVLNSMDVRDLGSTGTETFVRDLESLLLVGRRREAEEICAAVRMDGERVVVESCMDDQPFLVSSLRALLGSEGFQGRRALNAVVQVRRDNAGSIVDIGSGTRESVMRIEARSRQPGREVDLEALQGKVVERLRLAQAMVRDFEAMKRAIQTQADGALHAATLASGEDSVRLREAEALLRWLCDENYVLFSVEEYDREGRLVSALGRGSVESPLRDEALLQRMARGEERLAIYRRSAEESPVHRSGKPGHFVFTRVDRHGRAIGCRVIDGLFTYKALHTPPEEIPFLRVALRDMLLDREVSIDSHRGKNITNAFNSLPLEYLLAESRENVWDLTDRVLRAEQERGTDVHIKIGEDRRFTFVVVTLPRAQLSEALRLELQDVLLGEFGASYADYGVYIDRYENAIVHFYLTGPEALPEVDTEIIRDKIKELAKGWEERLRDALASAVDTEAEVAKLFDLYVEAFTEEHRSRAGAERLSADITRLESIRSGAELECDLFVARTGEHPGSLNLRIYSATPLTLSAQLPVIGSFGFQVVDEYTRLVRIPHMPPVEVHTFRLDVRRDSHNILLARAEAILPGLREVFAGRAGGDSLNRLIAATDLGVREVELVRAYVAYMHQLGVPFDSGTIRQVLVNQPGVTQALMGVLRARFDPELAEVTDLETTQAALEKELRAVTDYTADRVLSTVAEVVRATLRTNAFVAQRSGRGEFDEAFAFKIAAGDLSYGPSPKPYREIWVYHPEIEGVHLRGGKVARGGLRFSDRPDDFRSEIHGLMATQMVKNVLIVPMGAKGGFILRTPPTDRRQLREAGDRGYRIFIRALLSITDNVIEGEVKAREGIIRPDGDDPYLVVAADKGTAHLSDTANKLSMDAQFWLDDAFASGGSHGYDHKATGITARGAWEATKRSFRELGIDPEADVITAIGVGDMSGDVFGNGLLRSRTIKLQAAFNHLHIFIDPDPVPEDSFVERQRLFETPGSQWSDYAADKMSEGGGVWPRKSKEVELSAKARELLGIGSDEIVSGDEVIQAIMRLKVDLFWMGGIGTYVKSSDESNADVGDKGNDSVRIDARELNCRVFGEGANLAITDRGRVEFARRGGQNYTAFLDNSGGVDVSDHEVNIKIAFAPLLANEKVSRDRRNEVLKDVEDEICEMVLDNNRSQSRMVSYDVRCSRKDLWRYSRTLEALASEVPFDPEGFSMPSNEELANRFRRKHGLHKCEAAVLGSNAKMLAYRELLAGNALPEALSTRMLRDYFPARVREALGAALPEHLLRREISTTMLVNKIVDNAGASFFTELIAATGRSYNDVAIAYMQVSDFGEADEIQRELYALEDKHRQEVVYDAMKVVQSALEEATFYLLGPFTGGLEGQDVEAGQEALKRIAELLPSGQRRHLEERAQRWVEKGIPAELAMRIESRRYLDVVIDATRLARAKSRPVGDMLRLRLAVASAMKVPELKRAVAGRTFQSPWDGPAVRSLSRQLEFHVHKIVHLSQDDDVQAMLKALGLERVQCQIADHLQGEVSIADLVMIDGQLRRLLPPSGVFTK